MNTEEGQGIRGEKIEMERLRNTNGSSWKLMRKEVAQRIIMNTILSFFNIEFQKSERSTTHFRLLEIPDVARINVIRSMDHMEQIKLALSSKRIERYMKVVNNKKSGYCEVRYTGSEGCIATSTDLLLCYGNHEPENPAMITRELKPWMNEELTVLENTVNLFERYRNAFPYEECRLVIHLKLPVNVKAILETPIYKHCTCVVFKKGKITKEDLDAVMDTAHNDRDIEMEDTGFPINYDHENVS
uniref:F-box domain-containing protein n=2 Tax=Caenorhabditis tropicalis TaxID=1561998 RepID=A0A1I7TSE4_9PELO